MTGSDFLILGCGYTGARVARRLVAAGCRVVCTNRHKIEIPGARCVTVNTATPSGMRDLLPHLCGGMRILHSIPTGEGTHLLLDALRPFHPSRLVYLSTTGVYGAAESVDARTPAAPNTERDAARLETERLLSAEAWPTLILRPAAIYGPGRGVHTSARSGIFRPPPGGDRLISRIHVDDLANQALAALRTQITGAFPTADEEPCPSSTVAAFAFAALGVPFATGLRESTSRDERKTGRRVDGSACRDALGLPLAYPTYREGVLACLRAEEAEQQNLANSANVPL